MGHPDGQNYAIWRGPDFFANPTFPLSASNPATGQGQITNFASVYISTFANNPGGISVVVQWFADAAMTLPVRAFGWSIPAGYGLACIIPAEGNFVQVKFTTTDVGATNSPITVLPTNTIVSQVRYIDVNNNNTNVLFSVPANATVTLPLHFVMAGKGHVYVQDVASSGKLAYAVAALNVAGAVIGNVIAVAQPIVQDFREFNVPEFALQLRITNTDAVNPHNASALIGIIDR